MSRRLDFLAGNGSRFSGQERTTTKTQRPVPGSRSRTQAGRGRGREVAWVPPPAGEQQDSAPRAEKGRVAHTVGSPAGGPSPGPEADKLHAILAPGCLPGDRCGTDKA